MKGTRENPVSRWLVVVIFAAAMAWVESAVVFYLRTMIDRIEPYQPTPLPRFGGLAEAELVRELSTLVMLSAVGWLAGRNCRSRIGYALLAFGVWDIFYYAFLKVLTGWPHALVDWDILFLVPLPWWGPVWAPISIACLMIAWGTMAALTEWRPRPWRAVAKVWMLNLTGVAVALYVFMADALRALRSGATSLRDVLPQDFNTPLFLVALLLMAVPILDAAIEYWFRRELSAQELQPT